MRISKKPTSSLAAAIFFGVVAPVFADNSGVKDPVGRMEPSSERRAAGELIPLAPEAIQRAPALAHIASSGARLFDLGEAHGLRGVLARNGREFMILQLAPDGGAVVAGAQTQLSVERLLAIAGGEPQSTDLGTTHGLRALFIRNGAQFQTFYATPDGEAVIPGVMWDADGANLTRPQVAPLPGVAPSVSIGKDKDARGPAAVGKIASGSALEAAEATTFGLTGAETAPRLYMFIDPLCGYSMRALEQLAPFLATGRAQAAIIPVSVLDYEDEGRSTTSALAMLSKPEGEMAQAWSRGDLKGPPSADAAEKLRRNMAAAEAIGLRGTPTLIWRKADGSEGRMDGLPADWEAVIASMEGPHVAR